MNTALAQLIFEKDTLYKIPVDFTSLETEAVPFANETSTSNQLASKTELSAENKVIENLASSPSESAKIRELIVIVSEYNEANKEFLSKILTSVGRNINDIEVFDKQRLSKTNVKELISQTKALFSFGVPFTQLGFKSDLGPYTLKMVNGKNYLFADDLNTIMLNSNNEKRSLWNALKKILE
jgi:hypothetical protein